MKIIEDKIRQILTSSTNEIVNNIESKNLSASGKTAKSLRVEVVNNEGIIVGKIFGRDYFGVLETGRKAGPTPRNFTAIIKQWIIDKAISYNAIPYKRKASQRWQPKYSAEERGLISLAGAISYKIRTQGTRQHREGARKDIFSDVLNIATRQIMQDIRYFITIEIESIIRDENNK